MRDGRIHGVVAVGCPHHVTQRGNSRRQVFFDDEDHHTYLDLLAAAASQAELAVLGFCLLTNHVHLIAVPAHAGSMALALREATRAGRLFGTTSFVAELEAKLDRPFFPQKPGPKPKCEGRSQSVTE